MKDKNRVKNNTKIDPSAASGCSGYSSLEWTFAEIESCLFGSGPYLFVSSYNDNNKELDKGSYTFRRQVSAFEDTGTYIRGVVAFNGYFLAWGGSYIARIWAETIENGRTVCPQDILSTGRQIVSLRSVLGNQEPVVEIYYAEGIVEIVRFAGEQHNSLQLLARFRLPLKSTEKISTAHVKSTLTLLGTSHGRIMVIQCAQLMFTVDSGINNPVKQLIALGDETTGYPTGIVLLFENGSIAYWENYLKGTDELVEMRGRYTSICSTESTVFGLTNERWMFIIAGDMDGNLTGFWVDGGIMKATRTIKSIASNRITVIAADSRNNLFIGTEMGDFHWFKNRMHELQYDQEIPFMITNSTRYYKTAHGWYYLEGNKLREIYKLGNNNGVKLARIEEPFVAKNMKMKYMCCTATPDREIAIGYDVNGYCGQIRNYSTNIKEFSTGWNAEGIMLDDVPVRIIQVIIMQSYILVQDGEEMVTLKHIDAAKGKCVTIMPAASRGRITSAACLEEYTKPMNPTKKILHLVVGYPRKTIGWAVIVWNTKTGKAEAHPFNKFYEIRHVDNYYFVAMLTSQRHLGSWQCVTLDNKGTARLLCAGSTLKPDHDILAKLELHTIIGRGHSLYETSLGIFAAGFKWHTLNVCWISMGANKPSQYSHLFSVETRHSHLPFTFLEEKIGTSGSRRSTENLIVSYYDKERIKEKRFPFFNKEIDSLGHSGIITDCCVCDDRKEEPHCVIFTGDTNGNLCAWTLDDKKQSSFSVETVKQLSNLKLNGSITCIMPIFSYFLAVSTSQGDLYVFVVKDKKINLRAYNPYKLHQKIDFLSFTMHDDQNLFCIQAFLADGTVKTVPLIRGENRECIRSSIKPIEEARFPVPAKMSISTTVPNKWQEYFALTLGTDGILRRARLSATVPCRTIAMKWRISVIRLLLMGEALYLLVADQHGWIYTRLFTQQSETVDFYIDQCHKSEVIDIIAQTSLEEHSLYIFSLDRSGIVVIRRRYSLVGPGSLGNLTQKEAPVIWACPVPSPRKITVLPGRKIMVIGKGVATRSY